MYGQKPLELVQGPGEVLFLPQGLTHSILNLHDNVAYTENYLYVGALPGKIRDIISETIDQKLIIIDIYITIQIKTVKIEKVNNFRFD